MPLDDFEEEVASLLKDLWKQGIDMLYWSADPASSSEPWSEGWSDVYIEEICQPLDLNWLLTILSPKDEEAGVSGSLRVPFDAELVFEFADEEEIAASKKTLLREDGSSLLLSPEQDESSSEEEKSFYWSMYRQEQFLDKTKEVLTYRVPVWTLEKIGEATGEWIKKISGHQFELIFKEDLKPPIHKEVEEALENIKSGKAEVFDLGDGIKASDSAMDVFMQNPELAAEITTEIKKILKEQRNEE